MAIIELDTGADTDGEIVKTDTMMLSQANSPAPHFTNVRSIVIQTMSAIEDVERTLKSNCASSHLTSLFE